MDREQILHDIALTILRETYIKDKVEKEGPEWSRDGYRFIVGRYDSIMKDIHDMKGS